MLWVNRSPTVTLVYAVTLMASNYSHASENSYPEWMCLKTEEDKYQPTCTIRTTNVDQTKYNFEGFNCVQVEEHTDQLLDMRYPLYNDHEQRTRYYGRNPFLCTNTSYEMFHSFWLPLRKSKPVYAAKFVTNTRLFDNGRYPSFIVSDTNCSLCSVVGVGQGSELTYSCPEIAEGRWIIIQDQRRYRASFQLCSIKLFSLYDGPKSRSTSDEELTPLPPATPTSDERQQPHISEWDLIRIYIGAGVGVAFVVAIAILLLLRVKCRRKEGSMDAPSDVHRPEPQQPSLYSLANRYSVSNDYDSSPADHIYESVSEPKHLEFLQEEPIYENSFFTNRPGLAKY